jgi:spermidine synthase
VSSRKHKNISAPFALIFFFSGGAALGCQVVWAKACAATLGSEWPSVLAVVTAFMTGMAIGNFLFMRVQTSGGRWYAALEVVIGLWIWASAWLIPASDKLVIPLLGVNPSMPYQWTVIFGSVLLTLLPATTAMGATLPAAERFLTRTTQTHTTGLLYGANTAGAMCGAILAAFWIMPSLGIRGCLFALGAVSIFCGIAGFWIARSSKSAAGLDEAKSTVGRAPLRLGVRLFICGLLGIGFEVVMIHALAQVLENTIYTFAVVLGVFLAGTALGAAVFQGMQKRRKMMDADFILAALVLAIAAAGVSLRWTPKLYDEFRDALGDSVAAVACAETGIAAVVFLVPTILMGALWTALAQQSLGHQRSLGWGVGLNTTGAAVAPFVFGALAIPSIGLQGALAVIPIGYAALVRRKTWVIASAALAIAAVPIQTSVLQLIDTGGGKLLTLKEGMMGTVAVLEDSGGGRVLKFNNRFQMGGTAAGVAEERQAHIPLLLHHAPRRALFIGLGTGITFNAARNYKDLVADGVELVPEIAEATRYFRNDDQPDSTNLRILIADGRRYVRTTGEKYDVIVSDLFHPAQDGAGFLYTLEHFTAIRSRLTDTGIFCQWLPVYQMDLATIQIVIATFSQVFPEAELWLLRFNLDVPVVGLIARRGSGALSKSFVEEKTGENARLAEELKRAGLNDSLRVLGCYVGKITAERDVEINSDLDPIIIFRAPALTFKRQDDAGARLLHLLASNKSGGPEELVAQEGTDFTRRLEAFVRARDVYIQGLQKQNEGALAEAIEAHIRSAALSEDFTAGYAQALAIATGLAKKQPEQGALILRRLIEARPELPVARELLRRLENDSGEQ